MKRSSLLILPLLLATPLFAQEPAVKEKPAQPTAETDPAIIKTNSSYGLGFNSGSAFKQQMSRFGITAKDLDREAFIKGILDAVDGKDPAYTQEKLNAAMLGFQNMVQEREKVLIAENLQKAEEFLAKNKEREGVLSTESGLQYEVIKTGDGESHDGTEGAKFLVNSLAL